MTFTWEKAIDDVKNNDLILKICCHVAKTFMIHKTRVNDAYGGYCGSSSKRLPKKYRILQTTTGETEAATASSTNSTNTSEPVVQTEWKVNIYIQPDPFSPIADNLYYGTNAESLRTGIDLITESVAGLVKTLEVPADGIIEETPIRFMG